MNSKQVVLITGSSTGFGRMFADTLARKGHTVFATMRDPGGRNAKNASEIRTLAEKDSLPIHVLELDVTDDASVGRAVDAAVAKAGRIDVAINNAGYGGLWMPPSPKPGASTWPSTMPATTSRDWRKPSPPNKRSA